MVTFRTLSLALLAMAVEVFFMPQSSALGADTDPGVTTGSQSGTRADMSVTAEVIGGGGSRSRSSSDDDSNRFRFGRKKVVEFIMPPVALPDPQKEPPPVVTLFSDPALRAKYPPNPGAPTVQQSLRQKFGRLVKFEYELRGPDEEALVAQSRTNALMSLAGRVYFDDKILLSQDLLPKYFDRYGDRFVRSIRIANRRIEGGQPAFAVELIADYDALLDDLTEKRFVFRPQLRPIFYAFVDQTINGQPAKSNVGSSVLEAVIRDRNQRYAERPVTSIKNPNVDATSSRDVFLQVRQAAQRNNVEVAVSGKMVARPADLEAPISEKDWADNTLEVAVDTKVLAQPVAAHLPVDMLLQELDAALKARRDAEEREWWDVESIEVQVPLEAMVLTDADRKRLEESDAEMRAIVPASRIGLKRNYYKPYYYTVTRMNLALVRVDNGEILAEENSEGAAAADTRDLSVQGAIQAAADKAVNPMIDQFLKVWPTKVGNEADYRILTTDITPQEVDALMNRIESSAEGVQVHLRSLIGNTAVIAVKYPYNLQRLVRTINEFSSPRLRLVAHDNKTLEFEKI